MKSGWRLSLAAVALVGATAAVTAEVVRSQQEPAKGGAPQEAGGMDPEMMKRMMELATPGPEHAALAKRAGQWESAQKMRLGADAPWMEIKGTSEAKALLGGRYLLETVKSEMMGMPFEGILLTGFDKMNNEYVSLWADSMSTWWVTSRGKADASGKIDFKGTMVDIAGSRPFRMVVHPKGDSLVESEMYDTIPPQGEVKVMTIVSKKKPG